MIEISGKKIGKNNPVFFIAEAGINHNGDIEIAKKMIDAAKDAGADAVKFQTFKSENLVTKKTPMAEYQEKNLDKKESQQDMLKKLELKYEEFKELKEYCDKKDIIFLSTPHTEDALEFLDEIIPAHKLGSGDITNIPFLEKVAKTKKPVIISTGMSDMEETKEAVKTIKPLNNQIIVLHCTSNYPCIAEDVNFNAMKSMIKEIDAIIGYSDHTMSTLTPALAVVVGAHVIEKHFTLDKKMDGPDHKASLNPEELKQSIENIRYAEKTLGSKEKKPTDSEIKISEKVRKSIVTSKDIEAGEIITEDKLTIKRPASGIPPKNIKEVIGKKTKKHIEKDTPLSWEVIE